MDRQRNVLTQRQAGLSLIELMVALLLGLVLMAGVLQVYLGSKQTYNIQEAQSRLQENGRLAMYFLPKDIRMTGFQGCRSRLNLASHIVANVTVSGAPTLTSDLFDITGGVSGSDNVTGMTIGSKAVVDSTDVITLQFGGSCGGHLTLNMTADNADIQIDDPNSCDLQPDWPFMITDCEAADIVRVSSLSSTSGIQTIQHDTSVNTTGQLSKAYQTNAEVFTVQSFSYFINTKPDGNPALFRHDNVANSSEELVEGVEDMQIQYGEDTDQDGAADRYLSAGAGGLDMTRVVAVKISLLLRSIAPVNVTTQPVTYQFNGTQTTAAAGDHQLRKVFTTLVTIRNRMH
jgi:type IV pilus assembly protein PilW